MMRLKRNTLAVLLFLSPMSTGFAAEGLSVSRVELEFHTDNNVALASLHDSLRAKLTVLYSGAGLLEGRWFIAEPGSTEGKPVYRTLLLVRENLVTSQRSILESPELPTVRVGKYLLKFCVTNRSLTNSHIEQSSLCPNKQLIASAFYQVLEKNDSAATKELDSPTF